MANLTPLILERKRRAQELVDRETERRERIEGNKALFSAVGGDALAFPKIAGKAEGLLNLPPAQALTGLEAMLGQGFSQGPTARAAQQATQQAADLETATDVTQLQRDVVGLESETFGLSEQRRLASDQQLTGFESSKEAIEFGQQAGAVSDALGAVDQMIFNREQMGAIGPLDFIANPEAAAAVDQFQSFETVIIFKTLATDQRVSDEDREFYSNLIKLDFSDWLFAGGRVELAKLNDLQRRLERSLDIFAIQPGARSYPQLFQRRSFGDIPGAVTRTQAQPRPGADNRLIPGGTGGLR